MKTTTIPAGYRVTVSSWENDGDSPKTKVLEGLDERTARFAVDFARLFRSKNGRPAGIGNHYEPNDAEQAAVARAIAGVVAGHSPLPESVAGYFEGNGADNDGALEYAYELGLSGGDFYTRVLEGIKVEHVPEPVVLHDVTAEFKPKTR